MVEDTAGGPPLLEVENLRVWFPAGRRAPGKGRAFIKAVDGVSFSVQRGETLGLVGESGCGKTTTARAVLRLLDPTEGRIRFDGVDLAAVPRRELRLLRRRMQPVFQDPFASLNPKRTVERIVAEPLVIHRRGGAAERRARVAELLATVGLPPDAAKRYPHAFSGGQRQRIGIARALALNPRLIVADEPVSALDVSVQAQVLNLMMDLQRELGLTYLFVAHDLSVVKHISDRIAVMYVGKMVEMAPADSLFAAPRHPYTEALLSAVPEPDPRARRERVPLQGEVANPANPPQGCYFNPRCQYATDICRTETPELREIAPNHFASCHRADELALDGVIESQNGGGD